MTACTTTRHKCQVHDEAKPATREVVKLLMVFVRLTQHIADMKYAAMTHHNVDFFCTRLIFVDQSVRRPLVSIEPSLIAQLFVHSTEHFHLPPDCCIVDLVIIIQCQPSAVCHT
jgi:hypothetical protein